MRLKIKQIQTNFTLVSIGVMEFYFSYDTCVAFHDGKHMLQVSENQWSPMTGKHLTQNFGNEDRVPASQFNTALEVLLQGLRCS